MKNKNTEKIIHDIKKIALTSEEKAMLFARLNQYADTHQPIKSPFGLFVWPYRYFTKPVVYVLASLLIIVLVGGTTVSASEKALPGDLLYPIKIHIAEPLAVALARTSEVKEHIRVAHIEERFTEAETLAIQGRLTTAAAGEIKGILGREVASLKDTLSPENQDDLDIQMAAHSVVLKSIRGYADEHQKANIDDIEGVTHASTENSEKNTNEEVKVEKPNTEKRTEKKNNNNDEAFSQRQTNVEQVIEDTNKKIEQNMTSNNSFERDILNSASSSLHTAKDSLKDAIDRQTKNKKDEASVFIGDSERNAKKAAVSVDRGLELGKIKRGNR